MPWFGRVLHIVTRYRFILTVHSVTPVLPAALCLVERVCENKYCLSKTTQESSFKIDDTEPKIYVFGN